MSFQELLYKCTQNDRIAQTEFYNRYVDMLSNVSVRYSYSTEDAKDVLQKSFVKVFNGLSKEFESENHLKKWMKRVVINTALNHKRNERLYKEHLHNSHLIQMNETTVLRTIEDELLLKHINSLEQGYQEIINLIVVDDFTHKEAAEILKIKESSSRGRYSRAIKKLRQKMNAVLTNQGDEK